MPVRLWSETMAWPEDLNSINSNLNTTELWMLKEKVESGNCTITNVGGMDALGTFEIVLPGGERYRCTEWYELIDSIERIQDGMD